MDKKAFGNKIRDLRKIRHISAEELAKALNISPSAIWNIELGYRSISVPVLVKLCNYMKISPNTILINDLELTSDNEHEKLYKEMLSLPQGDMEIVLELIQILNKNKK